MTPPDFVIAGAYRSGTTTLRRWLADHPQIFFPRLAEPSYFAFDKGAPPEHLSGGIDDPFRRRRADNWASYAALFADAAPGQITGDCSPEYLRARGSFERLEAARPDARVILTLRHPTDRLISDWQMCRRDGAESLDLRSALEAVDLRRAERRFGGHYVETSRYSTQLPELLTSFPSDQVLILIHEAWVEDRQATARQLASFLGITEFPAAKRAQLAENRSGEPSNQLTAALFRARRRLAPTLGHRVPQRVRRAGDRLLQRGLASSVDEADRAAVDHVLAEEINAVEAVLGRSIPEWHR